MGATGSGRKRLIVVWDAPNVHLKQLLCGGSSPAAAAARIPVKEWLAARAAQRGLDPSLTVFINIPAHDVDRLSGVVRTLRLHGFGVYARPKPQPADDIDDAMVRYLEEAVEAGDVAEVIVASHDRRAFAEPLSRFARAGIAAAVLGSPLRAPWVAALDGVALIDLELVSLPADGALLAPLAELTECPGQALVLKALGELTRDADGGWVRKVRLHPMLRRLDPAFTPQAYGYTSLNTILAACGPIVKTRQVTGDHELTLAAGAPPY